VYSLHPSKRYKKALKRLTRSGQFDWKKLDAVLDILASGNVLPPRYGNHSLQGKYADCFECHIKSDLLLIYKIDEVERKIAVVRIGSHSDLFR